MNLYMVAIILLPTAKEKHDAGTGPLVIVQPQAVMAKDENQAAMKAFRFIPEEHAGKEDRLEVKVPPVSKRHERGCVATGWR